MCYRKMQHFIASTTTTAHGGRHNDGDQFTRLNGRLSFNFRQFNGLSLHNQMAL